MKRLIAAAGAIAALAACDKGPELECEYIIAPLVQQENGGPLKPCPNTLAYAFYADTSEWTVPGYEDAAAGRIVSRTGQGFREADLSAVSNRDSVLLIGPFTGRGVMLVICNTDTRSYALRQDVAVPGMDVLTVKFIFRPWKTESPYIDSKWRIFDDVECRYTVDASVQAEENGPAEPMGTDAVAYAFQADTVSWTVSSFDDAFAGRLTNRTSGLTLDYLVMAGRETGGFVLESITSRKAVLLVCDPASRSYGIKQVALPHGISTLDDVMTLRTWKTAYPYYGDGWRMTREEP